MVWTNLVLSDIKPWKIVAQSQKVFLQFNDSYCGTLFFYNKAIVVNSCSDIPSSGGEHFFW